MSDKTVKIDFKAGRRRIKPLTQKQKAAAREAAELLPPIYAPPPPPQPAASLTGEPPSPTESAPYAAATSDAAGAAGISGMRGPSPAAQAPPEPYNFHRDEPTYGTFFNEPLTFEIPQAKKRGPVRYMSLPSRRSVTF